PWLTRDAAEWLLARQPTAVAFDFPQDYPIRLLLDGVIAPTGEHVTHDVLLRAGVTLIEYLVNTSALKGPRTYLCAAPMARPQGCLRSRGWRLVDVPSPLEGEGSSEVRQRKMGEG